MQVYNGSLFGKRNKQKKEMLDTIYEILYIMKYYIPLCELYTRSQLRNNRKKGKKGKLGAYAM